MMNIIQQYEKLPVCFVRWLCHCTFPPSVYESSSSSLSLSALGIVSFFSLAILISMVVLKKAKFCFFWIAVCKFSHQVSVGSWALLGGSACGPDFTLPSPSPSPVSHLLGGGEEGWLTAHVSPSSLSFVSTEGRYYLSLYRGPPQCALGGHVQTSSFLPFPHSGLHTDHFRGALLWWVWDERQANLLWEELQPAEVHVHHPLHPGGPASGRAPWAVPAEHHPDHPARLPLHQDQDQCCPEGGGEGTGGNGLGRWPWLSQWAWVSSQDDTQAAFMLLHGRLT